MTEKMLRFPGMIVVVFSLGLVACGETQKEILPTDLNLPLPSHLELVVPAPNSEYSVESYTEGMHYPPISQAHPAPEEGKQRICSEILSRTLLEPGDYFKSSPQKGEFLPDRITLHVDGDKLRRDDEVIMILVETEIENESGQIIARAPASHLICWPVDLGEGLHIATIEIKKTSGEIIDYSWSFTLD
jgi:hypothetical protein